MKKIIILMLCTTFGCAKSGIEGVLWEQLNSAPWVDVSKKSLPEWLVTRINYTEARPTSFCKVLIYRGEWNKQTVYFIMDTYSSCLGDFYTENGKRVDNLSDCRATSKNWVLIYEYGDFVIDLDSLFSN